MIRSMSSLCRVITAALFVASVIAGCNKESKPAEPKPAAVKKAEKPAEKPAPEKPKADKPAEKPAPEQPKSDKPVDEPPETPKVDAPKVEEAKADEKKVEEPKADEKKVEAPTEAKGIGAPKIDESDMNLATVSEKGVIDVAMNKSKDHQIFGYAEPKTTSKKLIVISAMTLDVENNPHKAPLGAFYSSEDIEELTLTLGKVEGDFATVTVTDEADKATTVYIEAKRIELPAAK